MDKMKDINVDALLKATIESQKKENIPVEFELGTKVIIQDTGDTHLIKYLNTTAESTGIQQNYSKKVKKTKVILYDGETAYFKNDYLERKVD